MGFAAARVAGTKVPAYLRDNSGPGDITSLICRPLMADAPLRGPRARRSLGSYRHLPCFSLPVSRPRLLLLASSDARSGTSPRHDCSHSACGARFLSSGWETLLATLSCRASGDSRWHPRPHALTLLSTRAHAEHETVRTKIVSSGESRVYEDGGSFVSSVSLVLRDEKDHSFFLILVLFSSSSCCVFPIFMLLRAFVSIFAFRVCPPWVSVAR